MDCLEARKEPSPTDLETRGPEVPPQWQLLKNIHTQLPPGGCTMNSVDTEAQQNHRCPFLTVDLPSARVGGGRP